MILLHLVLESFNLWRLLLMIIFYYPTKTPINFWYRQKLNLKSLIQPSKFLLIKLTESHLIHFKSVWMCWIRCVGVSSIFTILTIIPNWTRALENMPWKIVSLDWFQISEIYEQLLRLQIVILLFVCLSFSPLSLRNLFKHLQFLTVITQFQRLSLSLSLLLPQFTQLYDLHYIYNR